MIYSDKECHLNRNRFIRWTIMAGKFNSFILSGAEENLILGNEHIVSIEGLLEYCQMLPGYLFDKLGIKDDDWVVSDKVTLVYNRKEKP